MASGHVNHSEENDTAEVKSLDLARIKYYHIEFRYNPRCSARNLMVVCR